MKTKSIALLIASASLAFGINAAEEVTKPIASAQAIGVFFDSAKTSFAAKDYAKTFTEINNAAKLLTGQAKASTPSKYGKPLTKQATELNNLAFDVRAGKVSEETVLDQEFAETHNILATYFQSRSKRSIAKKAKDKAASAMNATANHIEATARRSGQKLNAGAMETVSLLRKTSDSVVSGTEVTIKKSEDALKKGKKVIKELGKMLEEKTKESSKKAKKLGGKIKGLFGR